MMLSPYLDQLRFHWAGFTADVRSLESGGWKVKAYHSHDQRALKVDARHRSMNLGFIKYVPNDLMLYDRNHQLPLLDLDFSRVFDTPSESTHELILRILKMQEAN